MEATTQAHGYLLQDLSKDELIAKVLELELVLEEFQDSSKDLEQALELELQQLESTNQTLQTSLAKVKLQLDEADTKIVRLTQELNDSYGKNSQEIAQSNQQLQQLQQQLIAMEITNDTMESQDRILNNKLHLSNQFNNELLERIALIESDLEREKSQNVANQMYINNYQNQVKELTEKLSDSNPVADESTVSLTRMLGEFPDDSAQELQAPDAQCKESSALNMIRSISLDLREYLGKSHPSTPANLQNFKSSTANNVLSPITSTSVMEPS